MAQNAAADVKAGTVWPDQRRQTTGTGLYFFSRKYQQAWTDQDEQPAAGQPQQKIKAAPVEENAPGDCMAEL